MQRSVVEGSAVVDSSLPRRSIWRPIAVCIHSRYRQSILRSHVNSFVQQLVVAAMLYWHYILIMILKNGQIN